MNKFSDFGIPKPVAPIFIGDKIKMNKILNCEIEIVDFIIEKGNFSDRRLKLQLKFKDELRIIFTSAKGLLEQGDLFDRTKLPFTTTIIEENERFEFT